MSTVIAFADAHIRDSYRMNRPEIRGDGLASLQQIVYFTRVSKPCPDAVISAGDMFHSSSPDAHLVASAGQLLAPLSMVAGTLIRVKFVDGIHDGATGSWLEAMQLPHVTELVEPGRWPVVFGEHFRAVGVKGFSRDELLEGLSRVDPSINLVVLHAGIEEACPLANNPLRTEDLPPGGVPRLYFVGGVHRRFHYTSPDGLVQVVCPGSTWRTKIDECPDKYFCRLKCDEHGVINVEFIPLKTRMTFQFVIRSDDDLRELTETQVPMLRAAVDQSELPDDIRQPIVEVAFVRDRTVRETISAALERHCHLLLTPLAAEREAVVDVDAEGDELSIKHLVRVAMGNEYDEETAMFLTELYEAANPEAVLAEYEKRAGATPVE